MTPAVPLVLVILAAVCGIGGCAVAHRLLRRPGASQGHCGTPAGDGAGLRKIAPLLVSALACGVVMVTAFYLASLAGP